MRRRGLLVAGLAALVAAAPAAAVDDWKQPLHTLHGYGVPRVWTTVDDDQKQPGYIFITPRAQYPQRTGPTILDANGHVVWFHRLTSKRTAIGLRPATYEGQPVLIWGQRPPLVNAGDFYTGNSHNTYNIVAGQDYRVIARVRARGRGVITDLHDFDITSHNTALVLGSRVIHRDLSRYAGARNGLIRDGIVQEVDVKTNKVLFSWSIVDHLAPTNSYVHAPASGVWDAYHVNAVSEDSDGNLLVTVRHLSQVVKVDRRTGKIIWILGGKKSDFRVSPSARFYYPHDASRAPDGTLTIFDNRATGLDKSHGPSRGIRLKLDMTKRTATLAKAYHHPVGAIATSQGSVQELPGGGAFVGWGSSPWFSEYAPDGHLVFAAHMRSAWNQSYRAFKGDWSGKPGSLPVVAASTATGRLVAFVSWNGATNVAQWQVLGGRDANTLRPLASAPWQDFETKILSDSKPKVVQVQALDAGGNVIATSKLVTPRAK